MYVCNAIFNVAWYGENGDVSVIGVPPGQAERWYVIIALVYVYVCMYVCVHSNICIHRSGSRVCSVQRSGGSADGEDSHDWIASRQNQRQVPRVHGTRLLSTLLLLPPLQLLLYGASPRRWTTSHCTPWCAISTPLTRLSCASCNF